MSEHHSTVRAVAYYRASTLLQEKSIPQQREWAHERCKAEGINLVAEFQDEGISGNKTRKRCGFLEMLKFCQSQGDVVAVVCWEASRFSRADGHETGYYIWQFRQAGVCRMLTHEGWTDWEHGTQRLIQGITQELANHEPLLIHSARVIRGQVANVRGGGQNGGAAAYGLEKAVLNERGQVQRYLARCEKASLPQGWKTVRVPSRNRQEVDTVRWLFEQVDRTDASLRGLASELNARGVPSPRGGRWETNTVRNILKKAAYKGDYLWGEHCDGDYNRVFEGEIRAVRPGLPGHVNRQPLAQPGAIEPIVSAELWDRVQRKLLARKQDRRKPRSAGFALTGLLHCGHCGARMHGDGNKPNPRKGHYYYRRYICRSHVVQGPSVCNHYSIREDKLLPFLIRKLQDLCFAPQRLDRLRATLRERWQARREGQGGRLEAIKGQLAGIEGDIAQGRANLLRTRDDGVFRELSAALSELVARKGQLEGEAAALEQAGAARGPNVEDVVGRAIKRLKEHGPLL
jgi:DNA invertase Pin-like site-specific DNA recombinase